MSFDFNPNTTARVEQEKNSIKKLRERKLKSLKTEKKLNEILTKLTDAPEAFFSEISSIATTINSFSKEYKHQIFDCYVSALNGTQKLVETRVAFDNTFEKHFDLFVESFNLLLNEKNKNDDSFIFVLFRNHKYDLVLRLLRLCAKNKYRLDFNVDVQDEAFKSLNFIDMLISQSDSINSMIDKNKKYKNFILYNNVDDKDIKLQSLEKQIEKERILLNKIHDMLDLVLKDAKSLIKLNDESREDELIAREIDKINFHLNITNSIRNLESLYERNILRPGRRISVNYLDEVLLFINGMTNSHNFEHFRNILFDITRSLINYDKAEEVLYILRHISRNISKDSLFRFIYDLKNIEKELSLAQKETSVVNDNRFKMEAFKFQGNGSFICSENLFDSLLLNNFQHSHSEKRTEILYFFLTLLRDDPVYIRNFCDIYCGKHKNKAFFKSLAFAKCFSLAEKMDLLVKIDSLVNDNKNYLRSLGKTPHEFNFFQISFSNLKYFIRQIDLDTDQGLEAFRSLLNHLNLFDIRSQVETKFNRRLSFDKVENMLETFVEIDSQSQPSRDKRLVRIYNNLKPEFACWIKMQNNSKKLENILSVLLEKNLLDFEPFYAKRASIRNMYGSFTPFTKVSLLHTLNDHCKRNEITLDQKNIKTIITKVLNKAQDNSYRLTEDSVKTFNFIYRNLILADFIDFFNSQILKNSELLPLINRNNQEQSLFMKSVLIFLLESIKIATEVKNDAELSTVLNTLKFLHSSPEANYIAAFKENSLQNLKSFSYNFTKVIFGSLESLFKNQLPEFENSYFYYDKATSSSKVYKRKVFSQSFLAENGYKDSNIGLYFIKDFVAMSSLLEGTWNTDFDSLNKLQKFNYCRLIRDNSFKRGKNDSESFLLNLFSLFENNLNNYELEEFIRSLLKIFLFNVMKKEYFFKSLSFLLNRLSKEKFPNSHKTFLDFLEEILKENFDDISENHVSLNYGPSSIYYSETSDKNYFFEFVYFIFRDFILTDFNTDEANFLARFRIMNLLAQFLKKMRNQEFYEYFNIAIYYVFNLNFLKQKQSFNFNYEFKKIIESSGWFSKKHIQMLEYKLYNKQTYRKLGLTNVAFNSGTAASGSQHHREKIRFDFKKLYADNCSKTKTKIKSLGLILLYKLSSIRNKDNLSSLLKVYIELRAMIVESENLLNCNLKNKFCDLFYNEFENAKANQNKKKIKNQQINSSLFISGDSIEELINSSINIQSRENSEHEFIEDHITMVEIYDTLFNLLSEYYCYFDSAFFRSYFKNVFYRLNNMKLDNNVNNCVTSHLTFLDLQINEFCRNILPNYLRLKQDLNRKIESLPADAEFTEFFKSQLKSTFNHPIKSNFKNNESEIQPEKANDAQSRKGQAEPESKIQLNYNRISKFTSRKFYLNIADSQREVNLLLNGLCPDSVKLPSFLALRISEENRELNKLVKEFNSKIKFGNYVFAPVVNVNIKSQNKKRRVLFNSEVNALVKNNHNLSCCNLEPLQRAFVEIQLKKFNFNSYSQENVFLNLPFQESLGHNLILSIIKDEYVYADDYTNQKRFSQKSSGFNRDNFLSFLDFNEKILARYSKDAYNLSLGYNPFSMVLQRNSGANLLKSYTETLIKLDQLACNFPYSGKRTDLNAFLTNFLPANSIFKLTDKKPTEAIDLFINTANIMGVPDNRRYSKDFEYDCFAFSANIRKISECFKNNSNKINRNGVALEALYYVVQTFLKNNNDLQCIYNYIPNSHQGNKEFVHYKCSKKTKNDSNLAFSYLKKLKRNVQETLNCHASILSDILELIDFKESQNKLTMSILSLLIRKAYQLINLQMQQELSNKGNNKNDNDATLVEAFYIKLLDKTVNLILPSTPDKKDTAILQKLWQNLFDLLELNVKILDFSNRYTLLYYDCLRKVILSEDSENNYNLKTFKIQLLSKPHKFILLAMSIQFNDSLIFEKLLAMTQAGILYEAINLKNSIISEYIYKSKKSNSIANNLYYCHSNNLNAFYLLLLNHQNKSEYYSNNYSYDVIKHLNFEVVFTEDRNVLQKLGLPNHLGDLLTNKTSNTKAFVEKYIRESEIILRDYNYENEVECYLDFIYVNMSYIDECYITPLEDPDRPEYLEKNEKMYFDYNNEKIVYEKLKQLLTSEENLLFSNQSEKVYFNFHQYIVYLIKSKRFEALQNLVIYNRKAADFILANQNFYLRIIAKYVKSYHDLDNLLRYLRTSELFVEKEFGYFPLFFDLVKLNNTNILNALIEENNLLADKLNLESIFTQEELNAERTKDSITLDKNFTQNKKFKFLIFNSIVFNSKDLLFFILEKITGKPILEELIDFNSILKLTVKNTNYPISFNPKYIELALNRGDYEMLFILLRLIKYDENWDLIFNKRGSEGTRWPSMSKIDLIIAELIEKKNASLFKFVKNINKPFLARLTYLYKIKLYLDKIVNEEALERKVKMEESQRDTENKGKSASSFKEFAHADSYEIQNCLKGLLNNRMFIKNMLFLDNTANEFLDLKEFINLIFDLPTKVFKLIIIILFLVFKIKPMNLDYFHDLVNTHLVSESRKRTTNFLIFTSLLEKILKLENKSFMQFDDQELNNFDATLKIIYEIQDQSLACKLNPILIGDIEPFTLELENKNALNRKSSENSNLTQELEDEFRLFLNKNSALGRETKINVCNVENENIVEYAKDFYNSIKENMFTFNIYHLFAKEEGKVKLLMYEFLDSSKPNSLESYVKLDLMSLLDWSTLRFDEVRPKTDLNMMTVNLFFLFREMLSFENLFLRQILRNLGESEDSESNSNENKNKPTSLIEHFDFCVDEKEFALCVFQSSMEFSDEILQLLKNIQGVNLCDHNETLKLLKLDLHPNIQKPEYSIKQYLKENNNEEGEEGEEGDDRPSDRYLMCNFAHQIDRNENLLMHLLLFDQRKFLEVQQNYFNDIDVNKEPAKDNESALIDLIKYQKNVLKTISTKLFESLFDEKKENSLFRKTLNDVIKNGNEHNNETAVRKLFETLAGNYEINLKEIVKMYVTSLNKITSQRCKNIKVDIDFESIFYNDRSQVKNYYSGDRSRILSDFNLESRENINFADESYFDFFLSLIVDMEILIKIFDFYEAISSGFLYLDKKDEHIEDAFIKFMRRDRRVEENPENYEAFFIKNLVKNFNKHVLKLNFSAIDRRNEDKVQLKAIHDHNMNSLSQIIFNTLSFIIETFSEKPVVSLEEFSELIALNYKFNILSERREAYLKKQITKFKEEMETSENKPDQAEFFRGKTRYVNQYNILKFIGYECANINSFTIPIDVSAYFLRSDVLRRLGKMTNKPSKDYSAADLLKSDYVQSNEINVNESGKDLLFKSENLEEIMSSFYKENYGCLSLENQIVDFIDKIRITFHSVVLGTSDIKKVFIEKFSIEQENKSFYINPVFYYLADFYRSKSDNFLSYPVSDLSFIKKYHIVKENLDSLFEKVHCATNKRAASDKEEANGLRLLKRLLDLNIRKGFIEIDTWSSDKFSPKISENQKIYLTSLVKNYVLLDSLAGKLTDIHAEDLVKLVSILFKKGVENNKAFLKLVPQFSEFLEKFILDKNNFAVKNFNECFSRVFYVDNIKYEDNVEKVICPYQSDEPFYTFLNQIKLLIDLFYVKNPCEPNNGVKFGENIIQENLDRVYLGIDQLLDMLNKTRFDFNKPNHKLLGARHLFDAYMCFNSEFLLADNLNENEKSRPVINTIDVDFKLESSSSEAADKDNEQVILAVSKVNLRIEKIAQDNSIDLDFTIIISRPEDEKTYSVPLEIEVENLTDFKFKEKLYLN